MKLYFFIRQVQTKKRKLGRNPDYPNTTHEVLYVQSGTGRWNRDNNSRTIEAGDVLFNSRGVLEANEENPLRLWQVLFDESLFSSAVNMEKEALYVLGLIKLHAKQGTAIHLSKIGQERTGIIFSNMLWEFQNRYRGYSWAIRLKLIEFLITIMRDKEFKIPVKGLKPLSNSKIQDVIQFIHMEYMSPITVQDILELFPLSRSHFHALFKEETGKTFLDYLTEVRCEKAGELLVSTDFPISEISSMCGFNNISHFYHTFGKLKQMPPKQFREQGADYALG
ncbi:MAG: helix-turn-helix domain-containing protein [Spirochaetia bacterium]